ncbi:MAG TPA: 50S ribosomal protein L24 [Candidatus Babeliales bacterium]|jgi:large subunit ribosomal protein L24|nr:50S ribosomal protein L24 [Candidatus Babeliales bacterium]
MMRVLKKDKVFVLTGKNRGATGEVVEICPKTNQIKVKDVAVAIRHMKPRKRGDVGGIVKSEAFIDLSNVMPICGSCNKPTRVGAKMTGDNQKARICRRCGEVM